MTFQELSGRKRIGLALGGGVARGLAHIGVLTVLEKAGIPVDYVAGTSAGSIMGAMYCAGIPVEQIKSLTLKLRWWQLARPVWPRRGFVNFSPLARWLVANLGDLRIEDLKIPFTAVAADLASGEPVRLNSGPLAPAVQASCSVPGFVEPVELDGRLLGDGSLVDTVPVSILREMGAEYVIGVDIFASTIRPRWGVFGMGFNALEILVRRAGGGIGEADCLISPDLRGKTYLRLSKREEFFLLGEQAAQSHLERVVSDLALPVRSL
ncbi:MAG TPA: patatin-like phospholipase family protein [Anaerolineales bacterium]